MLLYGSKLVKPATHSAFAALLLGKIPLHHEHFLTTLQEAHSVANCEVIISKIGERHSGVEIPNR